MQNVQFVPSLKQCDQWISPLGYPQLFADFKKKGPRVSFVIQVIWHMNTSNWLYSFIFSLPLQRNSNHPVIRRIWKMNNSIGFSSVILELPLQGKELLPRSESCSKCIIIMSLFNLFLSSKKRHIARTTIERVWQMNNAIGLL